MFRAALTGDIHRALPFGPVVTAQTRGRLEMVFADIEYAEEDDERVATSVPKPRRHACCALRLEGGRRGSLIGAAMLRTSYQWVGTAGF